MEKNIILPPIPQDLMKSNLDLYNYLHALSKVLQEKQKADYKDNAVFEEIPLFRGGKGLRNSIEFGGTIRIAGAEGDSSGHVSLDTIQDKIRFFENLPLYQGATLNLSNCYGLCGSDILASYTEGLGGSDGSRFIKLTNGMMICWFDEVVTPDATAYNGNIGTYGWSYYRGSAVITLPAAFINNAYNVVCSSVTAGCFAIAQRTSASTVTAFVYSPTSGVTRVSFIAIGRWK